MSPSPPFVISYTLTPDVSLRLTKRLLAEQPPTVPDQLVCYCLAGDDELSNLGRHVEREVFHEKFQLDDARMHHIYGSYEEHSIFFVVVDQHAQRPVGTARTIRYSGTAPGGLPTLRDIHDMLGVSVEEVQHYHSMLDTSRIWDMGTTAVVRGYRSLEDHLISNMLYRAMHVRSGHEGVHHYVAVLDADIRRTLTMVGFPWEPLAGTGVVDHEGSRDSMFMYTYGPSFAWSLMANYRALDRRFRPIAATFMRRVIAGQDVDHRLMFDFSKCAWASGRLKKEYLAKL